MTDADDARDQVQVWLFDSGVEPPPVADMVALIAGYDERGERIKTLEADDALVTQTIMALKLRAEHAEADLAALRRGSLMMISADVAAARRRLGVCLDAGAYWQIDFHLSDLRIVIAAFDAPPRRRRGPVTGRPGPRFPRRQGDAGSDRGWVRWLTR